MDGHGLTQLIKKDHKVGLPAIMDYVVRGFSEPRIKIQLAGQVRIESTHLVTDEQLLSGCQARLVFAMLVVERARSLHRDELAEALWPQELPGSWRAALRGVVSKIRVFLTAAGVPHSLEHGSSGGYQLQLPSDVMVDVEYAHFAVESAEQYLRDGDPTKAIKLAEYGRSVAVRPFLSDMRGYWVDSVRHRIGKVLLWALSVLSESYAHRRRYHLAVRAAEDAIELEPFREQTYQLLMRLHSAAGNPAEALRVYQRCRQLLVEELGVEPTTETAALHLQLLRNGNE